MLNIETMNPPPAQLHPLGSYDPLGGLSYQLQALSLHSSIQQQIWELSLLFTSHSCWGPLHSWWLCPFSGLDATSDRALCLSGEFVI